MFGLGFGEIIIILVLALILLGPQRLPEVAKQLGKSLREFKKTTDDLKQQFESELYLEETRSAPKSPPSPPAEAATAPPANRAPVATHENVSGLEAARTEPVTFPGPNVTSPSTPLASQPSEPLKPA